MALELDIRRVINGKAYDTATAKFVATIACHGTPYRDFEAERTGLFLTSKGQWFLAGEGGAASCWRSALSGGDGYVHGEGIKLISPEQAREQLEQVNGSVEQYFDIEEG